MSGGTGKSDRVALVVSDQPYFQAIVLRRIQWVGDPLDAHWHVINAGKKGDAVLIL